MRSTNRHTSLKLGSEGDLISIHTPLITFAVLRLVIEPVLVGTARLLSDEGAPSPELMEFCDRTGMSLDWVFVGDLRPMVQATYRNNRAGS